MSTTSSDWRGLAFSRAAQALRRSALSLGCLWTACGGLPAQEGLAPRQLEFFENRIRPILVEHCHECHSQAAKSLKGGLRLDFREGVLEGGDSGPAIIAGQPDESLLIEAVRYESLEMPPRGKLPEEAIADLVQWVAWGAPDPRVGPPTQPDSSTAAPTQTEHWAFQPVETPPRPKVHDASWPRTATDFYVLSRLEQEGLRPVDDADRYTWLRRVRFDLTGLPPSVREIQDFVSDRSPTAYETVVDRLLAERAFGERWARHWLDLVGYADQIGTSNDVFAEYAWRYRDYVIDALNDDKPFDRFVREQLAGDLLQYETVEERATNLTATGFLVLGDLEIVEADKAKLRVDIVDQQVVKTSQAFLAMTIGCARCHDHKFDPIPQRDYYAIAGFFHNTDSVYKTHRGVWSHVNFRDLPETAAAQAERQRRAEQHLAKVAAWREQRDAAAARQGELDAAIEQGSEANEAKLAELKQERDELARRIGRLDRQIEHGEFAAPGAPRVHGVRDVESVGDMRITIRGNPRALADEVPRGFLQAASTDVEVPALPTTESGRRELADWIADPRNPLTARVAVNRIWQRLFGVGLVRSVDYFGVRGDQPSHPELLDHLAARFMNEGWSRKKLIRSLVLSRTYRLSSGHDPRNDAVDPDNRRLWRMARRRLDAEALRDAMLAVGDRIHASSGGPALPLEYPENVANIDPKNVNPPSFSLAKWRPAQEFERTIYLPVIRSGAQPGPGELRNVFDFTQPAAFAGQRDVTAVPTQALFLMNSPQVLKYAEALSERFVAGAAENAEPPERLEQLWLTVLNRPIRAEERIEAESFLTAAGWLELCRALLASNEFLTRM